jgi:hypothetical protein
MKRRNWLPWITMLALFSVSLAAIAKQQTTYRLTLICTNDETTVPFGGCGVSDINNKGELVGRGPVNGVPRVAFIWRQGEFIDLSSPLNANSAIAVAINDRSEVVGEYVDAQFQQHAFLWRRGEISRIEIAPGRFAFITSDINDRREVLLSARDAQDLLESFVWRARDGRLTRLEPAPGIPSDLIFPFRLNNRGTVIGNGIGGPAGALPFLWEDGTVMQIQLPPGAEGGNAMAINDRGVVVGVAIFPDRAIGYRWQDGEATELPSMPSLDRTIPNDINNRGVIVGISPVLEQAGVATLWPRRGSPVDVNTLIADDDPLKPFVRLHSANLINDRGEIVAGGQDSRNPLAQNNHYLLTPQR